MKIIKDYIHYLIKKNSSQNIVVRNKEHLIRVIKKEINDKGNNCDLNHIDVSNITDMSGVFLYSNFNGNISQWDTSNVKNMINLFFKSSFNGDISNWDVSTVKYMNSMFYESKFEKDISNWKPYNLDEHDYMFSRDTVNRPYWINYENKEERRLAIDKFVLKDELKEELEIKDIKPNKRIKL